MATAKDRTGRRGGGVIALWSAVTLGCVLLGCGSAAAMRGERLRELAPRDGLGNIAAKLEAGRTVRIAYLGGSITCQNGYRVYSLDWFRERYPEAKVEEIFAGLGGTPSHLGVFRLRQDVLRHNPDLLLVEFAVNDLGTAESEIIRSMEGIVRQAWGADPGLDVLFVYTARDTMLAELQAGRRPSTVAAMERVAEHYGIPSVQMGLEAARMAAGGELVVRGARPAADADQAMDARPIVFSADGVHPFEQTGHVLYMRALARSLPTLLDAKRAKPHTLPTPLRSDNREHATIVPLRASLVDGSWAKLSSDHALAREFSHFMPQLWHTDTPGAKIRATFRGTEFGIYDLLTPDSGQVTIRLDGKRPVVRSRFDKYTVRARIGSLPIGGELAKGVHRVTVVLHAEEPDRLSILHPGRRGRFDPKTFRGTNWYVGGIMIDGELIEPEATE